MLKRNYYKFPITLLFVFMLSGCHTVIKTITISDFSKLQSLLGFEVDRDDYFPLYKEVASWIGVPYKYGGNTRSGIDCSGLVLCIYNSVYGVSLSRSSENMYRNCKHISKKQLKEGDLVFFSTGTKDKISHVGIYLKDGYFVHASTSKGVLVNHLQESYYINSWIGGGVIKR